MNEVYEKNMEIIITGIRYNDEVMRHLVKKYCSGNFIMEYFVSKFFIKKSWLGVAGVLVQLGIKLLNIKAGEVKLQKYLEKCEVKNMGMGLDLNLGIKNIDISNMINQYVMPKTKDNAFVYELIKLLNEELDENMKTELLKVILNIFNEKRIITKYIRKMSKEIKDLSRLDLEFDEVNIRIKN